MAAPDMTPRGCCHYSRSLGKGYWKMEKEEPNWVPQFIKQGRGKSHFSEGKKDDHEDESGDGWGSVAMALGVTTLTRDVVGTSKCWLIDSGATHHMCTEKTMFSRLGPVGSVNGIRTGSGEFIPVEGEGYVSVFGKNGHLITFTGVLYIPKLRINLLSCSKMAAKGLETRLLESAKILKDGEILLEGVQEDGLYRVELEKGMVNLMTAGEARRLWHRRLAHVHEQGVVDMSRKGVVKGMHLLCPAKGKGEEESPCESCEIGKAKRTPFPLSTSRARRKLEIVWSDLHGPLRTSSKGRRARYVLTLVDDYSRRHWVYLLR